MLKMPLFIFSIKFGIHNSATEIHDTLGLTSPFFLIFSWLDQGVTLPMASQKSTTSAVLIFGPDSHVNLRASLLDVHDHPEAIDRCLLFLMGWRGIIFLSGSSSFLHRTGYGYLHHLRYWWTIMARPLTEMSGLAFSHWIVDGLSKCVLLSSCAPTELKKQSDVKLTWLVLCRAGKFLETFLVPQRHQLQVYLGMLPPGCWLVTTRMTLDFK